MAGSRCIWRPIHACGHSLTVMYSRDCSYQRYFGSMACYYDRGISRIKRVWSTGRRCTLFWSVRHSARFCILLDAVFAYVQMFVYGHSGKNIELHTTFGYRGAIPILRTYGLYQYQKVGEEKSPTEVIRYVEQDTISCASEKDKYRSSYSRIQPPA